MRRATSFVMQFNFGSRRMIRFRFIRLLNSECLFGSKCRHNKAWGWTRNCSAVLAHPRESLLIPFLIRGKILTAAQSPAFEAATAFTADKNGISRGSHRCGRNYPLLPVRGSHTDTKCFAQMGPSGLIFGSDAVRDEDRPAGLDCRRQKRPANRIDGDPAGFPPGTRRHRASDDGAPRGHARRCHRGSGGDYQALTA